MAITSTIPRRPLWQTSLLSADQPRGQLRVGKSGGAPEQAQRSQLDKRLDAGTCRPTVTRERPCSVPSCPAYNGFRNTLSHLVEVKLARTLGTSTLIVNSIEINATTVSSQHNSLEANFSAAITYTDSFFGVAIFSTVPPSAYDERPLAAASAAANRSGAY
jgi:hypothetical protein